MDILIFDLLVSCKQYVADHGIVLLADLLRLSSGCIIQTTLFIYRIWNTYASQMSPDIQKGRGDYIFE